MIVNKFHDMPFSQIYEFCESEKCSNNSCTVSLFDKLGDKEPNELKLNDIYGIAAALIQHYPNTINKRM